MKTNFSKTLALMAKMPGTSSRHQTEAQTVRNELVEFALARYKHLHSFSDLVEVIGIADRAELQSDVAAIRQIAAALKRLQVAHHDDVLGGDFEISNHKVAEIQRKAEIELKRVQV